MSVVIDTLCNELSQLMLDKHKTEKRSRLVQVGPLSAVAVNESSFRDTGEPHRKTSDKTKTELFSMLK